MFDRSRNMFEIFKKFKKHNKPLKFEDLNENHFEIIIDVDGKMYEAYPSHADWLVDRFVASSDLPEKEALELIPYFNVISFLTRVTGCIAVWSTRFVGKPNAKQRRVLLQLVKSDFLSLRRDSHESSTQNPQAYTKNL